MLNIHVSRWNLSRDVDFLFWISYITNCFKHFKEKESHSEQKLKPIKEIENESKLEVVFLKQRNPHTLHSNHGKMEQIS